MEQITKPIFNKNFLDKFVFFNPIFIDKLDYIDLEENITTYTINFIFIIIISLTLYFFFYDEICIIYYFLTKKKMPLTTDEKGIVDKKINLFKNIIKNNQYLCKYDTKSKKYYINNNNTMLKDINGQYILFDTEEKCKVLISKSN